MTNREQIESYCSYFEKQLAQIQTLEDRLHKKTLLLVILDTLSRARYPNTEKNKTRFCQLVKEHIRWQDGQRVSLYQVLLLSPPTNQSKLRDFVHASVGKWKDWGPFDLKIADPLINEIEDLAATDEERKLLSDSMHLNLLYAYRNHLIHEFREPGEGMETDQRKTSPHYYPMTHLQTDRHDERESWELVYPLGFFVALAESCLQNLNHYLSENDLDPYSCYKFGTIWNVRI